MELHKPGASVMARIVANHEEEVALYGGTQDGTPLEIEWFSSRHLRVIRDWAEECKSNGLFPAGAHADHMLNCGGLLKRRPVPTHRTSNKIEGYWRQHFEPSSDDVLPWPVAVHIRGFRVRHFLRALVKVQNSAEVISFRGFSINRITQEMAGSREFSLDGWNWPEGLWRYTQLGVPPSKEFALFITRKANCAEVDCTNLPEYK